METESEVCPVQMGHLITTTGSPAMLGDLQERRDVKIVEARGGDQQSKGVEARGGDRHSKAVSP